MKKILSFLAAGTLALGLIGCSGDLHDVDNSPFGGTSSTSSVFIIGGIGKASVDSSQYIGTASLDENSTGFEVPLNNGNFSLEFTYTGKDSWDASAGCQAFTIVEKADSWTDTGTRWGGGSVAAGGTGTVSTDDTSNINLTGLEAGTKYTLKGSLTAASGTLTLEKGLSGVGMDIINVKDGLMKDAFSATPSGTGDTYKYTYTVNAAEAGELNFVVRVGVNVWVPSKKADLAKKSVTVTAPTRFDQVSKIDYPITFAYDAWEYGYELSFEYNTATNALTVSSAKLSGIYICGNPFNWAPMEKEDIDGKVWSILATGDTLLPGWGPIYGISATGSYDDDCLRAVPGKSDAIAELDKDFEIATPAKGGDDSKNVGFSDDLKTQIKKNYQYKITVTITGEGTATIRFTEGSEILPEIPNLADGWTFKGNYYNSSWDEPPEGWAEFVETENENEFSVEFTTTTADVSFVFQNSDGLWQGGGNFAITELGKSFEGCVKGGSDSSISGLTVGKTYVLTVKVKDTDGNATAILTAK